MRRASSRSLVCLGSFVRVAAASAGLGLLVVLPTALEAGCGSGNHVDKFYALRIRTVGSGTVAVSVDGGAKCSDVACDVAVNRDKSAGLLATAGPGSEFVRWDADSLSVFDGQGCDGTDPGIDVRLHDDAVCTAIFRQKPGDMDAGPDALTDAPNDGATTTGPAAGWIKINVS